MKICLWLQSDLKATNLNTLVLWQRVLHTTSTTHILFRNCKNVVYIAMHRDNSSNVCMAQTLVYISRASLNWVTRLAVCSGQIDGCLSSTRHSNVFEFVWPLFRDWRLKHGVSFPLLVIKSAINATDETAASLQPDTSLQKSLPSIMALKWMFYGRCYVIRCGVRSRIMSLGRLETFKTLSQHPWPLLFRAACWTTASYVLFLGIF